MINMENMLHTANQMSIRNTRTATPSTNTQKTITASRERSNNPTSEQAPASWSWTPSKRSQPQSQTSSQICGQARSGTCWTGTAATRMPESSRTTTSNATQGSAQPSRTEARSSRSARTPPESSTTRESSATSTSERAARSRLRTGHFPRSATRSTGGVSTRRAERAQTITFSMPFVSDPINDLCISSSIYHYIFFYLIL